MARMKGMIVKMKAKKILKQTLMIIVAASMLLLLSIGESKAALQANQNTQYTKTDTLTNWMSAFRQMETAQGTMGLNETLNTDLTASSDSNGIDVHMMKATEYGAIAILSASGYGNPSNDKAITTTTGNNTGVILNTGNWEWTAGGLGFSGTNPRYFDTYSGSNTSARIGDALGTSSMTNPGCAGWHSASDSRWVNGNGPYFLRGNGGIFSFYNYGSLNYCRGVAVCGAGL